MLKQRWLSVFFLTILVLCLGWSQVSAQIVNSLIQQGLERYRSGDFQGAIDTWNNALKQNPNDQIILLKHLARVYSQVGQFEQAIASLNPLISYYQNNSDRTQLGRILTEQAQAYSNLGQQRRAIAEMIKNPAYVSSAKNSLGNTYANLAKRDYRYAEFTLESGYPMEKRF
jgi:tetratricopeptide (TPR) repeat protein